MPQYQIGSLVQIEITQTGWEYTIISTIAAIVKRGNEINYILAVPITLYAGSDCLENEIGFTESTRGRLYTVNHGLDCTVTVFN